MKKEDHLTHSKRRLKDRYGVIATDEYLDALVERIMVSDVGSRTVLENGNLMIEMRFRKRLLHLVFNPFKLQIATFLTPPVRRSKPKRKKKANSNTPWKYRKPSRNPHKQWDKMHVS